MQPLESRQLFSAIDGSADTFPSAGNTGLQLAAATASLAITSGTQTHATLADTSVTMTGRSELHITASSNPISGSQIQVNSQDAWLFFENVKPSVVNSTYLSQVSVNGAPAVHGTNVRVVQYGMGTVVIPHAPSYEPLTAFTGPNFTGNSKSFSQYTYYNSASSLGEMQQNISSFKLKRGYMATLANQANGTGTSKVFIAQDHDLNVSLLPAGMDNATQFVRVFPWRWVSKKGASDISPATLNASWFYNWNNNSSATLDYEYVPIRQQRWWPAYPTNQKDVTHLSGYNEPNNPVEDAYESLNSGSVDAAIAAWPELLASGVRVGSPAVTDSGKAWLYEFMDKAIAANLRVDYIAIHNYQAGHTAASLKSWLQDIYNRYHLPIWLTEFNNGANWTTQPDPTLEQNAAVISSFIDMMDTTPWIERYSIYSNVEDVRKMVDSSGNLTPAGVAYKNNASPVGYVQDGVPTTNTQGRSVAQLLLDGNTLDTSGFGNNGETVGIPSFAAGKRGQSLQFDGLDDYLRLTDNVAQGNEFSFAGWINWDGGANWQRIFDFGNDTNAYLFLTPSQGSKLRFAIKNGGAEQIVETTALTPGQWTHVALTLGAGAAKLYVNGSLVATNSAVTLKPGDFDPKRNFLGKSQFSADPLFKGKLDEVQIVDYVLSASQIAAMGTNAPPQFASATISRLGRLGSTFSGTLAGTATDSDDTIVYGKANGPAWLTVAANGTLSGTIPAGSRIPQEIVVTATDTRGASASSVLFISEIPGVATLPLNGNALDSSGNGNHSTTFGAPSYVTGKRGQAIQLDGVDDYLQLPTNIAHGDSLSFAAWVRWDGGANWQRIFDFGNNTSSYLFLTPSNGSGLRFAIKNGGAEQVVQTAALAVNQWTHVAVTLGAGVAKLYVNGTLAASSAINIAPSAFRPTINYLGKSQFSTDPFFKGQLDEVHLSDSVLTAAQIAELANNAPTVQSAASASPTPVTGKTTSLSVLGADDGGESNLVYSWATTGTPPAPVGFSANGTNAAKNTTATFTKAGLYSFVVTISDGDLSVTSTVSVTVNQTLTAISISPSTNPSVNSGATQQFIASLSDQFGSAMSSNVSWTVTGSGNSIGSTGLFKAGTTGGTFTVTAASGAVSKSATVTVVATTPSIFTGTGDIGSVGVAGSANSANSIYTLKGAGSDIFGTSDAFRFNYKQLTGSGQIVARVTGVTNTNGWAKAGIMFRESLAPNARNVFIALTPANGVTFQYRANTGGSSASSSQSGLVAPYWLKLIRSGNTFTGYRSSDGINWTKVGNTQTLSVSTSMYVGLAVTSHNNSTLATATFSNVAVQGYSNLAIGKPTTASSTASGTTTASAIDNNIATRWQSSAAGTQWLRVDLGSVKTVSQITLNWGSTFARSFQVQSSSDGTTWTNLYSTTTGSGGTTTLPALNRSARHVRIYMTVSSSTSYSLNELAVWGL